MNHIPYSDILASFTSACKEKPRRCRRLIKYVLLRIVMDKPRSYMLSLFIPGPVGPPQTSPDPWQQKLDDTHWTPFRLTWDSINERWDASPGIVRLTVLATWYVGYRPTMMRMGISNSVNNHVEIRSVLNGPNPIYDSPTYHSGDEVDLVYQGSEAGYDIYQIHMDVGGDYITNIEFKV